MLKQKNIKPFYLYNMKLIEASLKEFNLNNSHEDKK